jgi:hypothetical protein
MKRKNENLIIEMCINILIYKIVTEFALIFAKTPVGLKPHLIVKVKLFLCLTN